MVARTSTFQYSLVLCEIFSAKKLAAKVELSPSNVERFVDRVVESKPSPLRKIVEVLGAKMERRKKRSFTSTFVIIGLSLLREPGTIQVRQNLQASTAVHTSAAGICACVSASSGCSGKKLSPIFLNGSTFLQGLQTKNKASAKTALPKLAPTTTRKLCLGFEKRRLRFT